MKDGLNETVVRGICPSDPKAGNAPVPAEGDVSSMLVANIMNQLMRPILEDLCKMLKNNTEAIEQIAGGMDVIRNRMDALEKNQRLQTPVTDRQAKYLADAAKDRATELLHEKDADRKAATKLSGIIKKYILSRYGVGSLREIPRCEYSVAMGQIERWMDVIKINEIVKEARARAEEAERGNVEGAEGRG